VALVSKGGVVMTAKREWAKSTNGPDWTDVAMLMNAIQGVHSCRVELFVTAATAGHNGGLSLEMVAVFDVLPQSELPRRVSVKSNWPTARAGTISGLAYSLVLDLDYAIGKAYEQMGIPL
jgi:hypothetical protein